METTTARSLPWHVDVQPVRRWIRRLEAAGQADIAWERVRRWDEMVSDEGVVVTSKEGRVGWIELRYPPKGNAFVPPMYRMLTEAIRAHAEDDDVWVVILTGTGKNFSTGGYVGADGFFAGLDAGEDGAAPEPIRRTMHEMFLPMFRALYEFEKPTTAMLNGPVMAEAVDLALAADFRTGSHTSDFWFSAAFSGNTAWTGSSWVLPRLVGLARAKELLLSAERIDGTEAHRCGLLSRLCPPADLRAQTMELAARITSLPPITLRLIKKELLRGLEITSHAAALDVNSMIETIVQSTEDHMDAERAIAEKRAPSVRGR